MESPISRCRGDPRHWMRTTDHAHLAVDGQPACRAVPEAPTLARGRQVGRRFTSPCVLRSMRHVCAAPPLAPRRRDRAPPARLREVRSISTETGLRTAPRERHGSPRSRTPSLFGSRPLERPRARELCNRCFDSRHEVATHVCCASHVFATRRSCDRTTSLLSPLFARSRWIGALLEGREQPFAVAGSSAIGAPLFRELPPRIARAGR